MRSENENFVLVGTLNTLSFVYMTEFYQKTKLIHTSIFQKHIHKVKFYPSADDFTQALLVMLVTNIMSETEVGGFTLHSYTTVKLKPCQIWRGTKEMLQLCKVLSEWRVGATFEIAFQWVAGQLQPRLQVANTLAG